MRWMVVPLLAALLLFGAGLSGCVGSAVENSYKDADKRYAQKVTGGYTESHTIQVPSGTASLRVAVNYDVSGGFTLELHDPAHKSAKEINQGGVNSAKQDDWFTRTNPAPGDWTVELNVGGVGSFAVGVYLD